MTNNTALTFLPQVNFVICGWAILSVIMMVALMMRNTKARFVAQCDLDGDGEGDYKKSGDLWKVIITLLLLV